MRALRALALAVLGIGLLAGGVLVLMPNGWLVNRANVFLWIHVTAPFALQDDISPERFAELMNVLLFIPVFAALAVLRPTWRWALAAVGLSGAIELYQLLLGSREAELGDVLTNSIGGAIGVGIGLLLVRMVRDREARRACAAQGVATISGAGAASRDASDPTTPGASPRASAHGPAEAPDGRD